MQYPETIQSMGDPMKKLAKVVAVTLAMLLVLPLFACAGIQQLMAPTPSPTPTATPTPAPTATPEPTPTPTPVPTPKPDVNLFRPGSGNDAGYQSRFFGFSFEVPYQYTAYTRAEANDINRIQTNMLDGDAYHQEYIERLKANRPVYDFIAYTNDSSYLMVIVDDYSAFPDQPYTELQVLDNYIGWLTDGNWFDLDITTKGFKTMNVLGQEHPYYLFSYEDENGLHNGRVMALEHGTTFAVLLILNETDSYMNKIMTSIQGYR